MRVGGEFGDYGFGIHLVLLGVEVEGLENFVKVLEFKVENHPPLSLSLSPLSPPIEARVFCRPRLGGKFPSLKDISEPVGFL